MHRIKKLFDEKIKKKKTLLLKSGLTDNQQRRSIAYQRLIQILSNKNDLGLEAILQMSNNFCNRRRSSIGKVNFS